MCAWGEEHWRGAVVSMINAVRKRLRGQHIKLAYYLQWFQIQIKKISQAAIRRVRS
jgi:hypothetical protein